MNNKNTEKNEKRKRMIREFVVPAIGLCFLLVSFFTSLHNSNKKQQEALPMVSDVYLLDTFCEMTVYDVIGENKKETAQRALDMATDRLNDYDALFDPHKEGSDIYRINHRNDNGNIVETVDIDAETARLLNVGYDFCRLTDGALDPAIMPVTELWDIKNRTEVPSEEEISEALSRVKTDAWHVDDSHFYADDRDVMINAGSFAKGYIADRLKEILIENGVTSAIINLGGNVLCIGSKPDGNAFKISYKDAQKALNGDDNSSAGVIEVRDYSVTTAGIYERYFEADGVIYHHIMDTRSGWPVQNGLFSVTVAGENSAICDAMCTTLFIMGKEKGKAFLDKYNTDHGTDYTAIYQ